MFSIPINQKLSEQQFNQFLVFISTHKESIFDLYFTCRMPPFNQDAMGDIFASDEQAHFSIDTALYIQREFGITVSATFNNIEVRPTQQNLDLFIQNFQKLYDAGIRSATLPHTHWIATGQIQKAFPELYIKNTILRNVSTAKEVAALGKVGFNYVNLDRDLIRDRDALIECRRAADKYGIKLSLLANEGCIGNCVMMDEHYSFNLSRDSGPAYFADPISRVSCPKWDVEDLSTSLKTANITPWRDDWVELLDYIDVFKMHGRESTNQLEETMHIVSGYVNGDEILFDQFDDYINDTNLAGKPIQAWRTFIKNCKFNCWDCNKCDDLFKAKSGETSHPLVQAVVTELIDSVHYKNTLDIPGLTSKRVQNLIYGLGGHVNSYLEVGSAMGATVSPVGHNDIEIHCVDNWKDNIQAEGISLLPTNNKEAFIKNTKHIKNLTIHNSDMLSVDKSKINNIDMFFYDGPHDFESTKSAVSYYLDCLSDTAIIILDDANWEGVIDGGMAALEEYGMNVIYDKAVLNEVENPDMWWNGIFIAVVQK